MPENKTEITRQPLLLIVDDIAENLRILGNVFREVGLQIAIAPNGQRAISLAHAKLPDIILLDVQMPEMDGFEVCKILKESEATKHIPILFLTAKNSQEDILKGFELGAVDYIPKPFNQKELIARVKTHIELKQARERVENYAGELKELVATKDRFFNIIAHDLKSPFNAILGFTEALETDAATIDRVELQKFASLLHHTADNTFKLVQNLLEWSRLQTNKMNFEPKKLPLASIVQETVKQLNGQAISKQITINASVAQDVFVIADEYMISTVLRNLISNALKFSNPGSEIVAGASAIGTEVIVSVADQGVGISPEAKASLFDLTNNYTTRGTANESGTGLGLLLCKEIIEKHAKKLWLESEPGRGTTFFFTLATAGE